MPICRAMYKSYIVPILLQCCSHTEFGEMNTRFRRHKLFKRRLVIEPRMLMVSLVFVLGISPVANAANWTTDANLSVSETYTDNVRLSQTGTSKDLVTRLSPSIGITADGARINLDLDYSLNFLNYKENSDLNDVRHSLNFDSDFELIPDHWSAQAHSAITQQVTSARRQGSGSIVGSSNVVDTFQNRLSSAWNSQLGNTARVELGVSVDQVDYIANSNSGTSSSNQLDSFGHQSRVTLTNGDSLRRAFWSASFNDSRVEYENDEQAGSENGNLTLGYRWDLFSLSVNGGWQRYKHRTTGGNSQPDNNFYAANVTWHPSNKFSFTLSTNGRDYGQAAVDSEVKDQFIGSSVTWAPNVRTSLSASTGNNFYGDSYNFNFTHRSRKSSWAVNYGESITNARDSLFNLVGVNITCPDSTGDGCTSENVFEINDQDYLNKHGTIQYSYQAAKNNFSGSVFQSDRIFLGDKSEEKDLGVRLGWTWQFGRVSSMALTASRTMRQFRDSTEGDFSSINLNISGRVGRKTSWALVLHNAETVNDSVTDSYDESRVYFQLTTSLN